MRSLLRLVVFVALLQPASLFAYDILRVKVVDPEGNPLKARVTITRTDRSRFVVEGGLLVYPTKNGVVSIRNPLEGTYRIAAFLRGYESAAIEDVRVVSKVVTKPNIREFTITLKPAVNISEQP